MLAGMLFAAASCGGGGGGGSGRDKLVCGVTEYEPMNYRDASGAWTGFDTDFAKLVGEKLGMDVEFQEIEWGSKYAELEAVAITCIWNGFTANSSEADGTKRSNLVDFSYSYLLNQQCVVVRNDRAPEFGGVGDLAAKTIAAEKGSSGETFALDAIGSDGRVVECAAQINTLLEVKSGSADCAVVDILLAQKLTGVGDYSDLMIAGIELDSEVYAVGFKKDSELRQKVNDAMLELFNDGKLAELAAKYGLENSLALDTTFSG